jgi:hypothetical protein
MRLRVTALLLLLVLLWFLPLGAWRLFDPDEGRVRWWSAATG